jgi:hypothetical protein
MTYNHETVMIGDYLELDYDGWVRVTKTDPTGFNSVDSVLNTMIHLPWDATNILDQKLESEMNSEYCDNF